MQEVRTIIEDFESVFLKINIVLVLMQNSILLAFYFVFVILVIIILSATAHFIVVVTNIRNKLFRFSLYLRHCKFIESFPDKHIIVFN